MFDNLKTIDAAELTLDAAEFVCAGTDAEAGQMTRQEWEREADTGLQQAVTEINGELMLDTREIKRSFHDKRRAAHAAEVIERIPHPDEGRHIVVGGSFAMFDCLAAVLQIAATPADDVTISTLSFSKLNILALCKLLDAGTVGRIVLACSHYFAASSKPIWQIATEQLTEKRGQLVITSRTHAKILAIKLADGRAVTVESSANLRSCSNIEQMTVYGCPRLYDFHAAWIRGLAK